MTHQPRAEMLFEVSWEVCNKVGGIHTVIKSKLHEICKRYPGYVLLGPLLKENSRFEEREPPEEWLQPLEEIRQQGIQCKYGVWLTPEEPAVILLDGKALDANAVKGVFWEKFGVDSIHAAYEFDEPLLFSVAAGMLVGAYKRHHHARTVLHCHEWMAGMAILYAKVHDVDVATVFTTHATILGRTIMGNGHQLYEILNDIDPQEWAQKLRIQDKHSAETACAQNADVFTTVSEITGKEASVLLGRTPDVLVLNGFSTKKFATFEETSIRHNQARDTIRELVAYTFFPHYAFDLENTLFFFTSGRYEFQNKGIDVFIDALGMLNEHLKEEHPGKTIVVFFWVIMGRNQVRAELLEKKNAYYHIKSYVEWQSKSLLQRMVLDFLSGNRPGQQEDFTTAFMRNVHRDVLPVKREGNPALLTHDIDNAESDPILRACATNGLHNREEDPVKVLLYPGYLDGTDGLLHLDYYDATVGAHLGVFPSHYEPWGYTPLESAVVGVPAVTTDLAGFGRHVRGAPKGVFVIPREGKPREDVVTELERTLHKFVMFSHTERVQQGFAAKNIAAECDWAYFVQHYVEAHNLALERRGA